MSETAFRPAKRLARVAPSPILALSQQATALRAAGREIIDLTIGEPDFDTPPAIKAAGKAAIDAGRTKYTALKGAPDLIAAILARLAEQGLAASPAQVIACAGAKQVIHNALEATLDPGDEVILPAPYWTSYADMVRLCAGEPVAVPGTFDVRRGWRLDAQAIDHAVTSRTRWIVLNSPGNPTGAAADADELAALAEVLRRHPQVWLLCDDIYQELTYDPAGPAGPFAARFPDLGARVLLADGASKAYAMTGWRIGWGVGPAPLIAAMATVQSQTTSAPCAISQAAAAAALTGPREPVAAMAAAFRRRRDAIVTRLNAIPGFECPLPDGAFYVFPRITGLLGRRTPDGRRLDSDQDLCAYLLEVAGVAAVPGQAFGGAGHLRLSFAADAAELELACDRIAAACARLAAASSAVDA